MSETTTNDIVAFSDNDDHHEDVVIRNLAKKKTKTEDNNRINNMSGGGLSDDEATSYDELSVASDTSTGLVSSVRQWALDYDSMHSKAMTWDDRRRHLSGEVHDPSERSASLSDIHPAVASTSTTSSWMTNKNGRRENEKQPQKISPDYDQHSNDRPVDFSLRKMNSVGSIAVTSKSDGTPIESKTSVFDGRVVGDLEFQGSARQRLTHNTILRHHRSPDPVDNMFVARIRDERKRQRRERYPVESSETVRKDSIRNNRIFRQERRRRRYVDAIRQAQITMDLNIRCALNKAMSKKMAMEYKLLKNAQNPIYLRNNVDHEGFWMWRDDIIPLTRRSDGSIEPNELDLIIRDVDPYDTESSFESETNFDHDLIPPESQRRVKIRKTQNDRIQSVMRWGQYQQSVSSPSSGNHGGNKEHDRSDDEYYEEGSEIEQEHSVFVNESQDVDVDWSTIGQDSSDSTDFEVQQHNTNTVNGMTSDSSSGDQNEIEAMKNLPTRVIKFTSKKGDEKRRSSVVAIVEPLRPFNVVENTSNDIRTPHRDQEQVEVPRSFTATAKAISLAHIELFHGLKKMINAIKKTVVAPTGSTDAAETTTSLVVPINPEITAKQHALLDDLKQILDSVLKLMKNSGAANAATSTSRLSNSLEETVISAERVAEEIITSDLPQATTVDYATVIKIYQELIRRIDDINSGIQQYIRLLKEEMDWLVETYEWAGEVAQVGDKVTALLQHIIMEKVQENHNIPLSSLVPSLSPAQDMQEHRRRHQERRIRLQQYREQTRSQQQHQPINRPPRLLESFMSNLPDRVFPHRPVEMLLNGHVTRGSYFETNQMGITILEDGHILIIDSCMENATESRQPSAQNLSNSIPEVLVGPISTTSTLASSTLNPDTNLASSTLNPATTLVSSTLNPTINLASSTFNSATTLVSSTVNPTTTLTVPVTVTANSNCVPISPVVTTTYTSSTTATTLNFPATDSSYFTTTSSLPIYTSPIYTSPISVTNITMVNGGASPTDPQNSVQTCNRTRFNDFRHWPPVSEPLLYRSGLEPSPPPITTTDWIASPMAQVATVAANIATQRLRQRTNLFRFLRRPPPPVIVVTPATDDEEETGAERDEQESGSQEEEGTRNGVTQRRFRSFSPPFNGARASCSRWRYRSRAAGRRRRQHRSPSEGDRSGVMSDEITTRTMSSSSRPPPQAASSSSLPPLPPPPASLSPPPVALRSALPSRPTTGVLDSALLQCIDVGHRRWSSCSDFTADDQPSPEHNHRRNTATAAAADPAFDHGTAATAALSWSDVSYGAGGSSGRTYTMKRSQCCTNTSSVPTRKFKFASPVRGHNSDQQQ